MENYWWSKINIIMIYITVEYQKIINLLDDTTNQTSEFIAKNSVEISDKSRGT